MELVEQEELLNLTLAMASHDHLQSTSKKMKRKWSTIEAAVPPPKSSSSSEDDLIFYHNNSDGLKRKILKLLKLRDQVFELNRRQRSRMVSSEGMNKRARLVRLLVASATSVDEHNFVSAIDNLINLYQHVSVTGDSAQRVAAYFADALTSILLTQSPFHDAPVLTKLLDQPSMINTTTTTAAAAATSPQPLPPPPSSSSSSDEFLGFTHLYRFSPCYQFFHFTANQAILEAFEREQDKNEMSLHVIDLELSYGFQWPSLIQSLSEKAMEYQTNENRVSLRITGFARSLEELVETEARLVSFSKGFENINFQFLGLLRSGSNSNLVDLSRKKKKKTVNETVAVNMIFRLSGLSNLSKVSDTLKAIHSLDPSIVILVEKEGNKNITGTGTAGTTTKPSIFLSTFMESLHYYAAMFDSLDICLPRDGPERLSIEKNYLGKEIKQEMARGGCNDQSTSYLKYESWKGKMEGNGFVGIELSDRTNMQAKLLLRIRSHNCHYYGNYPQCGGAGYCDGFRAYERDDGRVISLGWQDRILVTLSAWHPAV